MAISEAQFETIIRYIDNVLLPEEEILFIKQMAGSKELQQAFDLELLLREKYKKEFEEKNTSEEDTMFEPADKYLERAEKILETLRQKDKPKEGTPVIALWNIKKVASAAAAAILITTVYIFLIKQNQDTNRGVNPGTLSFKQGIYPLKDTIPHSSSTNDSSVKNNPDYLAQMAGNYYNRYHQNNDDPVQMSLYYQSYRHKKYEDVLKATPADYETKGSNSKEEQKIIITYMFFYKALSYIETGNFLKAAGLLNKIIEDNTIRKGIYYKAQFYLLMVYMKQNDRNNIEKILKLILISNKNPNRKIALEIAKKI